MDGQLPRSHGRGLCGRDQADAARTVPTAWSGWSLGGFLVSLVAAELERGGERVDRLVMVDSFVPRRPDGSSGQRRSPIGRMISPDCCRPFFRTLWPLIKAQIEPAKRADLPERRIAFASLSRLRRGAGQECEGRRRLCSALTIWPLRFARSNDISTDWRRTPRCRESSKLRRSAGGRRPVWRSVIGWRLSCRTPVDRGLVGDNHFTIPRDAGLLDQICGLLVPVTASTIAQNTVPEPAE